MKESQGVSLARRREVAIEAVGATMRTQVSYLGMTWAMSGEDASAPDPVSAFLAALGSCLLMSLRVAANARGLEITSSAVVARCNEEGAVKGIELELRLASDAEDGKLDRLVKIAERGCYVRALVRDDVPVTLKLTRVPCAACGG